MHGAPFALARPATWGDPQTETRTDTTRYGTATTQAWDRLHPRLTRRSAWITDQNAELPVLHGLLIRLSVERLPGGRDPDPVWLGPHAPGPTAATSTSYGAPTCADSTWSTPTAC
jgi:hypothetical protein